MAPTAPKMSLLAQYDDLCRYATVLTEGIENEFMKFVKKCEINQRQHSTAQVEVSNLQNELAKARTEIGGLEAKLKHARNLLDVEMKKRLKAESTRDTLERQISLIREVLLTDQNVMNDQTKEKLAFLNTTYYPKKHQDSPRRLQTIDESAGSVLSPSDISFDKTDDDLDGQSHARSSRRSRSKRSSSSDDKNTFSKRRKSQEIEERVDTSRSGSIVATTTVSVPNPDEIYVKSKIETIPSEITTRSKSKRSNSEPSTMTENVCPTRTICKSEPDKRHTPYKATVPSAPHSEEFSTPKRPVENTPIRHFSSVGKLRNRAHTFCKKTVLKPETCSPCGRRIKFYKEALKCQDCRATCHVECKEQVPLPCVPVSHTPTNKGTMGTIADYTPSVPPMVPALIIHCVNEIEARGLTEVGLYRVSGIDKEVKDLKEKFLKGKGVPNLSRLDIHTVCGAVKDFLRSLREPLITRTTWLDFVNAAEVKDNQDSLSATYQAVSQLPRPNRDTLAFIILHLQRVAECPSCKMPVNNLAKVFSPTIVGFSVPDPSTVDMIAETKKQFKVMERLLTISSDYWNNFVNFEHENIYPTMAKTPERRPAPAASMLGPLPGSNRGSWSKKSREILGKTPLTPRNGNSAKNLRRPQFFSSPMIR